jgi:hypothetical protein
MRYWVNTWRLTVSERIWVISDQNDHSMPTERLILIILCVLEAKRLRGTGPQAGAAQFSRLY